MTTNFFFRLRPGHYQSRKTIFGLVVLLMLLVPASWLPLKLLKTLHSGIWVPTYTRDLVAGRYRGEPRTEHYIFLLCDDWEPGYGQKGWNKASSWLDTFETISARHRDSQGRRFQYSWFYPIDNFEQDIMARISDSARRGFGEIEVHWHHHHSDSKSFAEDLRLALGEFARHGALVSEPGGNPRFSFRHGNWTLDNSGAERFCGVDDEMSILMEQGCYADFTFPALGKAAQPSRINRVLFSEDTLGPKSYEDIAVEASVGMRASGMLILQGPLGLDFRNPRILIEYGALDDAEGSDFTGWIFRPSSHRDYFRSHRPGLWNRLGSRVDGKPEWVFVKIHAHGIQHRDILLGGAMDRMLTQIESYCLEKDLQLHYVTAREAYNLVRAAEARVDGPPQDHYDFEIPPPLTRQAPGASGR